MRGRAVYRSSLSGCWRCCYWLDASTVRRRAALYEQDLSRDWQIRACWGVSNQRSFLERRPVICSFLQGVLVIEETENCAQETSHSLRGEKETDEASRPGLVSHSIPPEPPLHPAHHTDPPLATATHTNFSPPAGQPRPWYLRCGASSAAHSARRLALLTQAPPSGACFSAFLPSWPGPLDQVPLLSLWSPLGRCASPLPCRVALFTPSRAVSSVFLLISFGPFPASLESFCPLLFCRPSLHNGRRDPCSLPVLSPTLQGPSSDQQRPCPALVRFEPKSTPLPTVASFHTGLQRLPQNKTIPQCSLAAVFCPPPTAYRPPPHAQRIPLQRPSPQLTALFSLVPRLTSGPATKPAENS